MARYSHFLEVRVINEDTMPAAFPEKNAVLTSKVAYEQISFHAKATFL